MIAKPHHPGLLTTDPDPAKLQFAIIPVVTPPTNAIAHGNLDAVMEHIVDSATRSDAQDLLTAAAQAVGSLETIQTQKDQLFARSVQMLNDRMEHLARRMDSIEQGRADKARRDEEERQREEERERERQEEEESEPPPGNTDETHVPTGELHTLPGKEEASPVPDDDDEPEILQRAPAPLSDPNEPQIPSTSFEE
jgi:hypothetical protein